MFVTSLLWVLEIKRLSVPFMTYIEKIIIILKTALTDGDIM